MINSFFGFIGLTVSILYVAVIITFSIVHLKIFFKNKFSKNK